MQIRLRSNGEVMYEEAFRQYIASQGGPSWQQTTTEILNQLNADVVLDSATPTATVYQIVSATAPVETDGQWYTAWTVTDMTQEQKDAVNIGLAASNKSRAEQLLAQSDWVEVPSVTNTANSVHLTNAADFLTYRNALRTIAVKPTFDATFPTLPEEKWSI